MRQYIKIGTKVDTQWGEAKVTGIELCKNGEKYGIDMELLPDTVGWASQLDARWTPEAFVIDERDSVVYRGRLNDRYFAPGKRRPKTRKRDLRQALQDVLSGQPVEIPLTDAVGCPIEGIRLNKRP